VADPEIMGGTPCIAGTRLTVYAVAARLDGGEAVAGLLDDYPQVTREQIEAAVDGAARVPFAEHEKARPWRRAKVETPVA